MKNICVDCHMDKEKYQYYHARVEIFSCDNCQTEYAECFICNCDERSPKKE